MKVRGMRVKKLAFSNWSSPLPPPLLNIKPSSFSHLPSSSCQPEPHIFFLNLISGHSGHSKLAFEKKNSILNKMKFNQPRAVQFEKSFKSQNNFYSGLMLTCLLIFDSKLIVE